MSALKSYYAKTHQGPYLNINEDDYGIDLVNKLFMIFDGFGGSGVGDKYVAFLKETIGKYYTRIGGDPDATMPFYYSYKYLIEGNALINAMRYAHGLVLKENKQKEMNQRGGASAISAVLAENIMTLVSVGNCISYLHRKGNFEIITFPDVLRCPTEGNLTKGSLSAPMSGFGLFEDLHLQIVEVRVAPEDQIIMMSEGAYQKIDESELKYVLSKSNLSPSEIIDDIFERSNTRGNMNNQTTILLQF